MKTKYLLFALPLVALCACNKEIVETSKSANEGLTIVAKSNSETKTVFEGNVLKWRGGENLYVAEVISPEDFVAMYPDGYPGLFLGGNRFTHFVSTKYEFPNKNAAGTITTTAEFTAPTDFPTTTFVNGKTYVAIYNMNAGISTNPSFPVENTVYGDVDKSCWNSIGEHANLYYPVKVAGYSMRIMLIDGQIVDMNQDLHLSYDRGIIPMYAFIRGQETGFDYRNLSFTTVVAVVKVNITNTTANPITIGRIALSATCEDPTLPGGKYNNSLTGFHRYHVNFEDLSVTPYEDEWATTNKKPNTYVNCKNTEIPAGQSEYFSIIIGANHDYGDITIKIFDENSDTGNQIGSDVVVTPGTIQPGKVYSKNINI